MKTKNTTAILEKMEDGRLSTLTRICQELARNLVEG